MATKAVARRRRAQRVRGARRVREVKEGVREVTVSGNRQVGFATEFARAMGVKPGDKLLEALVHLWPGEKAVMLIRRPKSYSEALTKALEGAFPEGADEFLRKLRGEWRD